MPESLTEELRELRERTERFAEHVLLPLEARLDAGELEAATARSQLREASKRAGLFTLTQAAERGGTPAGPLALTVLHDTLAGYNATLASSVLGPGPGVLAGCHEPLRSRYLEPLLEGHLRGAFAFTEPSDAEHPTRGVRQGDRLLVNGRKSHVTGGADADFLNTLIEIEGQGQAMIVIDRTAQGVVIEREFTSLDGNHHAAIRFDDVHVPAEHVIGAGDGLPRAMRQIGDTRLAMAAQSVGLCRWTLGWLNGHLGAPRAAGSALAEREGVRLRYADLRIRAFAARGMLYRTARIAEQGTDIRNEGMACKIYATETLSEVVDGAIQLVGSQALTTGHPLERLYRRVRSLRLAEGANDLLRINLARGALEFELGAI